MAIRFYHFAPPKKSKIQKNNNTSPSAETLPPYKAFIFWPLMHVTCNSIHFSYMRSSDRLCVFCSSGTVKFPLCLFRIGLLAFCEPSLTCEPSWLPGFQHLRLVLYLFVLNHFWWNHPLSWLAHFFHNSFRASCCFFKIGKHCFRVCFLPYFSFSVTVL